ncbi:MAG: hypothetical protein RJA07_1311 [Bacteroidota bacterium]|jgi:hypothetical protein
MSVFKFRVALEQDDTIFRDIEIKPAQLFSDFHTAILKSFGFDDKHEASFYKTNDRWIMGEEISLNKKEGTKQMSKMAMAMAIDDPHEKFIYVYDFEMEWTFLIELLGVVDELKKESYPKMSKSEGIAPKQYGNEPIIGKDVEGFEAEEIYDASETDEMGEEGEETDDDEKADDNEDEFGEDEFGTEESAGGEEY